MRNIVLLLCVLALLCAPSLWAQCSAVTSDGTAVANQVSKFTTDCNIEPSAITEANGNVAIGTAPSATYKLDVGGNALVQGGGLAVAPKLKDVALPVTAISGCHSSFGLFATITFGNQLSCSGFSLAYGVGGVGNQATTFISAPPGGEVSIVTPGGDIGAPIASFDSNGSSFHTPVSISEGFSAANSGFVVDSSADVTAAGSLSIGGNLSVGGLKNFKIDDPLDPSGKYMYHAAVESSEVMNIYTGNATTDAAGDAIVQLPAWFEALNGNFRYQLTVIGQFAQAIVAHKISNHTFRIKTDKPNVEVSWQVTGIRQDAYAKAHPLVVEEEKPSAERGYYLHPEVFGQPESKGIHYAHKGNYILVIPRFKA